MKQQIIEAAGKTWRTLGEKGEVNVQQLPRLLNENDAVTYQALGWLAREDKINYASRSNTTFVSLVESELKNFKNTLQSATKAQTQPNTTSTKGRKR